jgi:hypothetical protein
MTSIYVQFSDSTQASIAATFSCAQDPVEWPNQGQIATTDQRWHTYYSTIPSCLQQLFPTPA